MTSLRVAAAQLRSTDDPRENLANAGTLVRQAAEKGAQLIVLPEASMARFGSPLLELAQHLDGEFATGIRALAQETGVWVVAGMFEPGDDDRVVNTLIATDGERLHSYQKRHLFDAYGSRESDHVVPGVDNIVFEALGTRIGLATCYDVRFGHQFTELGLAGAELICLSASWAEGPGKREQWDVLTGARGLDSQCFLVACDQAWQEPIGKASLGVGRSAIISPVGEVLAQAGEEPEVIVADIDLGVVGRTRETLPVLAWQAGD